MMSDFGNQVLPIVKLKCLNLYNYVSIMTFFSCP